MSLSKGTGSSAGASPYAGTTDLTSFAGSDGGAGSSAADTLLTGMVSITTVPEHYCDLVDLLVFGMCPCTIPV